MSKFYSVKVGDKLKFIGCSCGYGLYLEDVVECVAIKLDKFFWINPHTGEKRMTPMGSPCFTPIVEILQEVAPMSVEEEVKVEVAKETEVKTKKVKSSPSRKKKSK